MASPKSSSIKASDRSMPAVIPADVQMQPSLMKMRSGSKCTRGNLREKSPLQLQCVVARFPSRIPAAASKYAPEHTLPVRRALVAHDWMNRRILGQQSAAREPLPPATSRVSKPAVRPNEFACSETPAELITAPASGATT